MRPGRRNGNVAGQSTPGERRQRTVNETTRAPAPTSPWGRAPSVAGGRLADPLQLEPVHGAGCVVVVVQPLPAGGVDGGEGCRAPRERGVVHELGGPLLQGVEVLDATLAVGGLQRTVGGGLQLLVTHARGVAAGEV